MSESFQLGRYRLFAELGHGGMADVYLAMVEGPTGYGFAKLAVVKRLRPHLAEDPDFVQMLIDEARITARLNHPNIVQMHEVGLEDGEYFLAMEYLDGQPLHRLDSRVAKRGTPLSLPARLAVVIDTLAGLHHAHELKDFDGTTPLHVVHRDVTPHNIFVTHEGVVKVVDFGIAKAVGRSNETRAGTIKGKMRYMAPEQAMGGQVDRRVDIFAVGIILWQSLTETRFWSGLDEHSIAPTLIAGAFDPSPRRVRPDIPAELERICVKALAHRPEDRYATAAEMSADLEAFGGASLVRARRELATTVKELFASERSKLRALIEGLPRDSAPDGAGENGTRSGGMRNLKLPPVPAASTSRGTMVQASPGTVSSMAGAAVVSDAPAPRAKPSSALVAGGAMLSALGLGLSLWLPYALAGSTHGALPTAARIHTPVRDVQHAQQTIVLKAPRRDEAPVVRTVIVTRPGPAHAAHAPPVAQPKAPTVPAAPTTPRKPGLEPDPY